MTTLRERLAQMHAEATYGTPYGKVDARVAAALVAVADAAARSQEPVHTELDPEADMSEIGKIVEARAQSLWIAVSALAAALGVSR